MNYFNSIIENINAEQFGSWSLFLLNWKETEDALKDSLSHSKQYTVGDHEFAVQVETYHARVPDITSPLARSQHSLEDIDAEGVRPLAWAQPFPEDMDFDYQQLPTDPRPVFNRRRHGG